MIINHGISLNFWARPIFKRHSLGSILASVTWCLTYKVRRLSQGQRPSIFRFICFYRNRPPPPAECNSFKLSQRPDLPNSQGRTSSVLRVASMWPSPLWRGQRGMPSQNECHLPLNWREVFLWQSENGRSAKTRSASHQSNTLCSDTSSSWVPRALLGVKDRSGSWGVVSGGQRSKWLLVATGRVSPVGSLFLWCDDSPDPATVAGGLFLPRTPREGAWGGLSWEVSWSQSCRPRGERGKNGVKKTSHRQSTDTLATVLTATSSQNGFRSWILHQLYKVGGLAIEQTSANNGKWPATSSHVVTDSGLTLGVEQPQGFQRHLQ